MTQLNYINKPIFDHGAVEELRICAGHQGRRVAERERPKLIEVERAVLD